MPILLASIFTDEHRRPHRPAGHAAVARRPVRAGHRLSLLQRLPRRQGRGARRLAARRRPTRYNDGQNYDPTNKWVLFGHHFAAISGAGR